MLGSEAKIGRKNVTIDYAEVRLGHPSTVEMWGSVAKQRVVCATPFATFSESIHAGIRDVQSRSQRKRCHKMPQPNLRDHGAHRALKLSRDLSSRC